MSQVERYSEEQERCLARIGVLGYSVGNYLPQECTWELSKQDIIEIVTRVTRPYLKDIDSVTLGMKDDVIRIDGEKETIKIPVAYIWLPSDSPNLVDSSLKNSDSAIKFDIQKYSKSLEEYAAKFCYDGKPNLIKSRNSRGGRRGRQKTGLTVLIAKIFRIEFDERNIKYGKEFGEEFKRNTELKIDTRAVDLGKGDYDIQMIHVTKSVKKKEITTNELRPTLSFNAH